MPPLTIKDLSEKLDALKEAKLIDESAAVHIRIGAGRATREVMTWQLDDGKVVLEAAPPKRVAKPKIEMPSPKAAGKAA